MLAVDRDEHDQGENVEVGWFFSKYGSNILYYTKHDDCMQNITEAGNNYRVLPVFPY